MQRPVTFIIWPNGSQHCEEILSMISENSNFEIIRVIKVNNYNIKRLTRAVYKFDLVNPLHLQGKVKYLQKMTGPIYVLYCHEKSPVLTIRGVSSDIVDSRAVVVLKEKIRSAFNSTNADGSKSHHHVIHSSDNDDDALRIIHLVEPNCLESLVFAQLGIHSADSPGLSQGVEAKRFVEFRKDFALDVLRAVKLRPNGEPALYLPIEETPHYQYLSGDTQPYLDYIREHRGVAHRCFYGPTKFDQLLDVGRRDFKLLGSIRVIRRQASYHIIDGLHRAAVAQFLGYTKIHCEVCFDN